MVLVIGLDRAGVGIQRDHGARIEIVARMQFSRPWVGIAYPRIGGLGVLVVGPGHPGRSATGLPIVALPRVVARFTLAWDGEGPPQLPAAIGVECSDVAAHSELAAGTTDDDLAVDDERHQGHILPL